MGEWDELIKEQQDRKKRIEAVVKKCLTGAAIIGAAVLLTGFYDGDQVRVETVYTVQPGDTLWRIGEEHIKLNTGGRRYLPEFVEGIKELNPWVKENDYVIHAGDKIRISYWVKKASD
jgi:nucleoid-associated protein YgaU